MVKHKKVIIFAVSFIIIALIDIFAFMTIAAQVQPKLNFIFDNLFLSVLLLLFTLIIIPSLISYFISFFLLKPQYKDNQDSPQNEKKQKLFATIIGVILIVAIPIFILWIAQPRFAPYSMTNIQPGELEEISTSRSTTIPITSTPSSQLTDSPTKANSEFTAIPTKTALFSLYFYTIDYSTSQPKGKLEGVKIKLYDSQDKLIAENITTQVITNGNIGTGGNAEFNVPLGTYKAIAETVKLSGTLTVTIKSFNDQQYYGINLLAKPITINGKYFYDANKNGKYDDGEQAFPNKKINAFSRLGSPSQLYSAGSAISDNSGNFSFTFTYSGSYALGAEQVLGYQELPQRWVDLSGDDKVNYDIYVWPL